MLETRQLIIRDLIDRGVIADDDLAPAHAHASASQATTIQALVALGKVTQRDLALARARVSEHPFVDLDRYRIDPDNAALLPASLARRATAFPIFVIDGVATLGVIDPHDIQAIELIRQATHHEIETVVCDEQALLRLIETAYPPDTTHALSSPAQSRADQTRPAPGTTEPPSAASHASAHDEPAPLDALLARAAEEGATSLHIDPAPKAGDEPLVRLRTADGLSDAETAALPPHDQLIAALRRFADLEHTVPPVPQDGTFEITTPSGPARAAVTIVPTHTGESVVVRFEPGPSAPRLIEELGMPDEALLFLRASLTHDAGLLLVSGPFASGRTTTAAAAAAQLASEGRIVVTIEECIETVIPGARQIRADARAGTPAPAAIRLAERLDADALLIGEIRDDATAHAAVHAANGGRLVIATIDTEPGASPAQRLIAAGIPSLSINDCYLGAIAQIAAPTSTPRAGQTGDPVVVFAAVEPSGTAAAAPALVADARDKASRGLITPDALASLERAIAPPGDETAPRRLSA